MLNALIKTWSILLSVTTILINTLEQLLWISPLQFIAVWCKFLTAITTTARFITMTETNLSSRLRCHWVRIHRIIETVECLYSFYIYWSKMEIDETVITTTARSITMAETNLSSRLRLHGVRTSCNPGGGISILFSYFMMTLSNGNIFRVTGPLCGEFTGLWGISHTKASDAELWCFLWPVPEPIIEHTMETLVIWDAIALISTSL